MKGILIVLLCTLSASILAETNYVDDNLQITLRTGQGNSFQIIKMLNSGTAMEILERNDKYARVRIADGTEGWVLTQYLATTPVARDRLVKAEEQLAGIRLENKQLKDELTTLRETKRQVEGEQKQSSMHNEKLQAELEQLQLVAARPMELERQNREISKRLQELELDNQLLQEENTNLRDRTNRDWFLAGALVLFIGLVLGLILPRFRKQKGWNEWH